MDVATLIQSIPAARPASPAKCRIQAFIFDVDGVLADTARLHRAAWQRLAGEEALYFDACIADALRGRSREESLRRILGDRAVSAEEFQRLADRKNDYYRASLQALTPADVLPGVCALLDELDAAGLRSAAASASRNAAEVLQRLGLADRFEVRLEGNDAGATRDGGELHRFLKAATRLGLVPERCAVLEDAATAIQEARNFGMKTIGLGCPRRLAAADVVFESLRGVRARTLLHCLDAGGPVQGAD